MKRIPLNGRALEIEERGHGDAVLLLHTGFIADGMRPLFGDPMLAESRRLVHYHRAG